MKYQLIAVVLSAAAAFAAATWVYEHPGPDVAPNTELPYSFDGSLPDTDRIAVLEQAVSEERLARQLLQEEVMVLTAELEELQEARSGPNRPEPSEESLAERRTAMVERRQEFERRNSPEGRAERLIEAGFPPGQAEWIVQREQELQMESLQARYEAGRSGDPSDFFRDEITTANQLREELGDTDYERYLEANGRSTSVAVSSIIGNSPAQSAGMQPGDEIVRYDGERVFSMTDINMVSMEGEPGQTITIDFIRDGVPMQIVMPRGPLGVTGGRRRN